MSIPPNPEAAGDIDSMALLAGQSVGLVSEIKPAGEIVREVMRGAQELISEKLMPLSLRKITKTKGVSGTVACISHGFTPLRGVLPALREMQAAFQPAVKSKPFWRTLRARTVIIVPEILTLPDPVGK